MMTLLSDLPENVIGVVASGEVTADDYESVLMPAVESRLGAHPGLRVLYQLGPDFTGFSSGAMWDDLKLGVSHWRAWEKIAVVTDLDWADHATRFLQFMMPCPVKVFGNGDMAGARAWVSSD